MNDESKAHQRNDEPQGSIIAPQSPHTHKTKKDSHYYFQRFKSFFKEWERADYIQSLILVVAAAYCIVSVLLWLQTRQQTSLIANQFKIDQRPYMVGMPKNPRFTDQHLPSAGQPARANMYITNIGKTPAIRMLTQERFMKYRPTDDPAFAAFLDRQFVALEKKTVEIRRNNIYPLIGHDLAPNAQEWETQQTEDSLADTDIRELQEGKIFLLYIGLITYRDAFAEYRTEFCGMWFGTDPDVWHICAVHNTIR